MEDLRVKQKIKKEKDNLYRLYQAGLLRVKDGGNSSGDESDVSDIFRLLKHLFFNFEKYDLLFFTRGFFISIRHNFRSKC